MNNNRILMEWLTASGDKVNLNKQIMQPANEKLVYAWSLYIDPMDKGNFMSADQYRGFWEGYVFETEQEALEAGARHLLTLEDEGELRGDPDDYTIEAVSIPISKVSKSTLRFSGM